MANYSQKLQSLRLDEEQRVDEFIAALGRGLAALGRTSLGGKVGRGIGALSSEKPKGAYGKVLGKWNPLSGRYEGGSGGTTAERLASWRQANQERREKNRKAIQSATPFETPEQPKLNTGSTFVGSSENKFKLNPGLVKGSKKGAAFKPGQFGNKTMPSTWNSAYSKLFSTK